MSRSGLCRSTGCDSAGSLRLPLGWDRAVLSTARDLMREYAGRAYRVDLLPLYPLHRELAYVLTRRVPGQA